MREWLAETHGPKFELFRHFLSRFFESDLISTPGSMVGPIVGAVSILLPWFPLFAQPSLGDAAILRRGVLRRKCGERAVDQLIDGGNLAGANGGTDGFFLVGAECDGHGHTLSAQNASVTTISMPVFSVKADSAGRQSGCEGHRSRRWNVAGK